MEFYYGYARVSTEDQVRGWSIESQINQIQKYAAEKGYFIKEIFADEGYSAASFNRPEWLKMEKALNAKATRPKGIIVVNYDRLSRNTLDGLNMLHKLHGMDISLIPIMQDFGLDPSNPFSRKMITDSLSFAQLEKDLIRHRTTAGMRQARESGRYIGQAPFGFRNARDERNKPIIQTVEDEAIIVRRIFQMFIDQVPRNEIRSFAEKNNIKLSGKMWLERMIQRPVYAGFVTIKQKSGPDKLVKGIHDPIVSEDIYWTANAILNNKDKKMPTRMTLAADYYLKGIVMCEGDHMLHSSAATGRHGHKYGYYECRKCKQYHLVSRTHEQFESILTDLSLSIDITERLKYLIQEEYKTKTALDRNRYELALTARKRVVKQSTSLEEKFINDAIDSEVYSRWKQSLSMELEQANIVIESFERTSNEFNDSLLQSLPLLTDLRALIKNKNADVADKQLFIRHLFLGGLYKDKKGFRTPYLNPLFSYNPRHDRFLEIAKRGSDIGTPLSSGRGARSPDLMIMNHAL
jgi:site-specific DNA recombinase